MADTASTVIIMGAGFSGLCVAIKLMEAGVDDFIILEKADDVGGTWRENTYLGAECDVPSALYSYSFEHNPTWQFKWAEQAQILAYLQGVAKKHGLYQKIQFQKAVDSATYDEQLQQWQVNTVSGDSYNGQYFVVATGQLHKPNTPDIVGQSLFTGTAFHSAQWDHSIDLKGKRIAVIGNAASALQFIPELAKLASQLTVFQRSANWVLRKNDRPYSQFERWLSGKLPWITKLYRLKLWLRGELILFELMRGNRFISKIAERHCRQYIASHISDPVLQAKLLPDYPIGAKRVLMSDDYYGALARDNVEVCTDPVANIDADGVNTAQGEHKAVDVIVYGTGFETNPFIAPVTVTGVGGQELQGAWSDGAHAYFGVTTHGFPNLMMMYGPNTNLGHNSIVLMIEAQADYIIACLNETKARGKQAIDVKQDVEQAYNDNLQRRLQDMVWAKTEDSWYLDRGRITNNWAGRTFEYKKRMRKVDFNAYEFL